MSSVSMVDLTFCACRYRGTYCGQDVAIKILKPERLNENLQREFQQEVSIMRWVLLQLKHEWKILNFHICFCVFGKYLLSFLCCLFIFFTYNNLCHDVSVRNCSFWTYHVLGTVMFSGHGCVWKESSHFPGHLQEPDGLQEGST